MKNGKKTKRGILTMKKSLALLLVLAMMMTMFAGCKSTGTSNVETKDEPNAGKEGVTLTLYGSSEDMGQSYMQKIISMYEEATGNKIDQQGLDPSNVETVALTKFTTGDIPDLFMHFGDCNLKNFKPDDNFVDWSDAEWVPDLKDYALSQATCNGKVVGLPFWQSSNSGCFYNKKIFEELDLKPATTQEEFDALCDKLLENGIQPIYVAAGDAWPLLYQFALDPVMQDHPEYLEKLNNGEMNFADIPEFVSMCEWFEKAGQKGYFGETFSSDPWDYCSEALGTGEAAMMFVWDTWFSQDYDNESYEYKGDDFGIMPIFMGACDEGTYEAGNLSLMLVNKNSKNVEAAKDFVNFMADPKNYNEALAGLASAAVFNEQTTNIDSTQYLENKDSVDSLRRPSIARTQIVGFNSVEGGKALVELMSGDITVDECIKLIDKDRNATLEALKQ